MLIGTVESIDTPLEKSYPYLFFLSILTNLVFFALSIDFILQWKWFEPLPEALFFGDVEVDKIKIEISTKFYWSKRIGKIAVTWGINGAYWLLITPRRAAGRPAGRYELLKDHPQAEWHERADTISDTPRGNGPTAGAVLATASATATHCSAHRCSPGSLHHLNARRRRPLLSPGLASRLPVAPARPPACCPGANTRLVRATSSSPKVTLAPEWNRFFDAEGVSFDFKSSFSTVNFFLRCRSRFDDCGP